MSSDNSESKNIISMGDGASLEEFASSKNASENDTNRSAAESLRGTDNAELTLNSDIEISNQQGCVNNILSSQQEVSKEIECNCDNNDKTRLSIASSVLDNSKLDVESDKAPEKLQESMDKLNICRENFKKSEVIVKSQSESLRNILTYDGDSSSEEDSDVEVQEIAGSTWRKNADESASSSDSETDSSQTLSESDSDTDSEDDSASVIVANDDGRNGSPEIFTTISTGAVKKHNQAGYDPDEFLSPVPDLSQLNINVDTEEFLHIGSVHGMISEIITVTSIPGTPAFDVDTCLFIDDNNEGKRPLGAIFDVLGPVSDPMYCIRFNNADEVKELKVKKGVKVYAAPKSNLTKFVFLKELLKIKGSDASWMNDQEEPPDMAEFSDDEKEREAKRSKKGSQKRKFDDSLERHKRYEKTMNQCNILNTRVSKMMDSRRNISRQNGSSNFIPQFDPSIPPPGFGALYPVPMPVFGNQGYQHNLPTVPSQLAFPTVHWPWQRTPPSNNSGNQHNPNTNF